MLGNPAQELFGVGLGIENAEPSREPPMFVLQRRHADERRWIELHRYPLRSDAQDALDRLVASGENRQRLRILESAVARSTTSSAELVLGL